MRRVAGVALLCLLASALPALADAPTLEHLLPAGVARGSTNVITVAGKFDPWPVKAWVGCPGVAFTAETNKGKFTVVTSADAPAGAHFVRLFNDDGASAPKILVVSTGNERTEVEPNDAFTNAPVVAPLPLAMNGRLDKSGDVDSFAVTLAAGQWLDARLDAYTLASKMDAVLRIVTSRGVQLAWNHDFGTLDPRILWQAPSNGSYVVQVMGFKYPADADVRLTGGDSCTYRLHLATASQRPELCPATSTEREPNASVTNATNVELPASVRGAVDTAGDEDWFAFRATKDESYEVTLAAASIGSALDAVLKITEIAGKELARSDDSGGSRDPRLEWKAPTNATYHATVANLFARGGSNNFYRLAIQRLAPDFKATLPAHSLMVTAGSTNDVKFSVTRQRGFDRKLRAELRGLPDGARAEALEISDKGGEHVFKLIAAADAKPSSAPVRIVVFDVEKTVERTAAFSLVSSSEDNGVPGGYTTLLAETIDSLWLTIKAKPASK